MPNSRYGGGSSRYCYEHTDILINHYDIMDDKQLQSMETILSAQRLSELQEQPVAGDLDFRHLQRIHEYIFKDLYPFAGEIRTENITKDGFSFAQAKYISEAAAPLFRKLMEEDWSSMEEEQLTFRLAYYMAELNVLHPFREGNGRSLREFIRCIALEAGYQLDWSLVDEGEILSASIESTKDLSPLCEVIRKLIRKK